MDRRMTRRSFLGKVSVTMAGVVVAACAPRPAPTPEQARPAETTAPAATAVPEATPPPAKVERQKVTFTMYGHPGLIEQMVPLFNETHPEVEVVFERSEGQGYWEKLTAAVAAGSAWDCFRGGPNQALGWGPKGLVADIMPFLEMDTTYPASDYLPGVIDAFAVEKRVYGLPAWCLTMWLFYNKRMFDEAGLPYPSKDTTWDEYVAMAKALTKTGPDGRVIQYGSNGWDWWQFPIAQLVWSNGGCFFYSDDMSRVCMDDPKTVEALQDIADLIHVHKTSPNPAIPSASPVGLLSDNVATEANGDYMPWDNKDVFLEKYEYLDATLCPTRNGNRVNIYWPDPLLINASSRVKEAAYKWISWFSADPDSIAIQCKVVFPVTKRAYEDPDVAARWLIPPRPKGMIDLALEHARNARLWKVELHIGDIENAFWGEIGRLWNNEATAEEVCRAITEQANEAMSKPVQ